MRATLSRNTSREINQSIDIITCSPVRRIPFPHLTKSNLPCETSFKIHTIVPTNEGAPERFSDGTQTRGFTHVDDVIRELEHRRRLEGVYNLGTREAYSFDTLVEVINDAPWTDTDPRYVDDSIPGTVYVHDTCADPTTFQRPTGRKSPLEFSEGRSASVHQYADRTSEQPTDPSRITDAVG